MARADRRLRRAKARHKRSTLDLALEAYRKDPVAFMKALEFHGGGLSEHHAEVIRNLHHIISLAPVALVTGMSRPEASNGTLS